MNEKYMQMAIELAKEAEMNDEVPVGAVVVLSDVVIGKGRNKKEEVGCALEHAELAALREASETLGTWHLDGADVYVTLEPCAMCAGAMVNCRVRNVYFGAYDEKAGCCGTLYNLPEDTRFNHRCNVVGGVLAGECAELLTAFFRAKRAAKKS